MATWREPSYSPLPFTENATQVPAPPNTRIGEQLIAAKLLTPEHLRAALDFQRDAGGYLTDILVLNGHIPESTLLRFLAEQGKARFITAEKMAKARLNPQLLDRIPVRTAERLCILPLAYDDDSGTLTLAVPEVSEAVLEEAQAVCESEALLPIIALRVSIRAGIQRFYYGDVYAFAALDSEVATFKVVPESVPAAGAEPVDDTVVRSAAWPAPNRPGHTETAKFAQPGSTAALEREIKTLRVSRDLAVHLGFERSVSPILHRALAFCFDTLPADDGAIVRVDERTGRFSAEALRSRVGAASEVTVSRTLISRVTGGPEVVLTVDPMADPRFKRSESMGRAQMRSAMGVPLQERGQPPGAIILSSRGNGPAFGEEDLEILSAIAAQTSRSIESARFNRRLDDNAAMRARFARHLPPAMVEMALTGELVLEEAGELRDASVVVSRINGFAMLAEHLGPRDVVALINEHFEEAADIVFSFGGVLDKFLSDGIVAVWGAGSARSDHAARALRAAVELVRRTHVSNEQRTARGDPSISVAVGVDSGLVVFGSMGTSRRMDLATVGMPVAVASALCGAAEADTILVSEAAATHGGDSFDFQPRQPIVVAKRSIKSLSLVRRRVP
jgi:adenylate cyclase